MTVTKTLEQLGYVKTRDDQDIVIFENQRNPGFNSYGDLLMFKFPGGLKTAENALVCTLRCETNSSPELTYGELKGCMEFLSRLKGVSE